MERWRSFFLALMSLVLLGIPLAYQQLFPAAEDADELYWLGSTYYFHLFVEGQWQSEDWQLLPARENPPLGKYVLGTGLSLAGTPVTTLAPLASFYLLFRDIPGAWGEQEHYQKRLAVLKQAQQRGLSPGMGVTPLQLNRGRMVIAIIAGISALVLFQLGRYYLWSPVAWLVSLVFLIHPVSRACYSYVWIDFVALLFSLLVLWHYVVFIQPRFVVSKNNSYLIVTGTLCLTFAYGSKMNAAIVVLLALILLVVARWRKHRCCVQALALLLVLSPLIFLSLNPTLLQAPGEIFALYYEHQLSAQIQQQFLPGYLESFGAKLLALFSLLFGVAWLGLLLVPLGLWQLKQAMVQRQPTNAVMIFWWGLASVAVACWLPFAWQRYVLPVLPPTCLLMGKAAQDIARFIFSRRRLSGNSENA